MKFVMELVANLVLRLMEDPKERDRNFREHVYAKTKEMWSCPLRPHSFWIFDCHNAQLFADVQISQAPDCRDPYDFFFQDNN